MTAQKDTIYIDVDDEITSIVEKVNKSSSKIVALVLPKRAVVLQSIVNMKLLKRNADEASKRVVLITSETGLMPLADAVGVYVAKNLQSKPEIPAAPETPEADEELLETEEAPEDPELDKAAAVGDLSEDGDEEDDIFESTAPAAAGAATATKAAKVKGAKKVKAPKAPKDKKNRVPNFDKFRMKVVIGVSALLLLLVAWYFAFFVAPRAKITITTETSTVNSSINFTASTSASTVNAEQKIVPAKEVESQKTQTQKVSATGQKDVGTKATGTMTISNCQTPTSLGIPAGSVFTASNGLKFISTAAGSVPGAQGNFVNGCTKAGESSPIPVVALANGDNYNLSAQNYSNNLGEKISSKGSTMSGGLSKTATVVSQQDIDGAKQKITDDSQAVKSDLQKQLEDQGYYALLDTFKTKSEKISSSPALDQEASEVTVTADRTYSMTGVKRDDLHALIVESVKGDTEDRKQQVQDDGINNAVFRVNESKDASSVTLTMQVPVILGPKIDSEQLKTQVAGKKKGDIDSIVKSIDGVKDVEVKYSPFWVSMTPSKTSKITIVYKEAKD